MSKILCIGESLVDVYVQNGVETPYAGGAPTNVCAYLSKMGNETYILTKLSDDKYSKVIINKLNEYGVHLDYASYSNKNTARAIVSIDSKGDRSFSFEREDSADINLSPNEIKREMFNGVRVLHFCSVGLLDGPLKEAHKKAINYAKDVGAIISFDLNVRLNLWDSDAVCKAAIYEFIKYANVIKLSSEELDFMTLDGEEKNKVEHIFNIAPNADIIFVTKGDKGSSVYDRELKSYSADALNIDVVDTTGAGDYFSACYINLISNNTFYKEAKYYKEYLNDFNKECSKICQKKGAL